jgi:hypothetical protein
MPLDHVSRQEREAERRRVQKEEQLQRKLQIQQQKQTQLQQKQRQQAVLSGAAFLLDQISSTPDAADLAADSPASATANPDSVSQSLPDAVSATHAPATQASSPLPTSMASSTRLAVGQPVRLFGLSTEWLNGAQGVVASPLDASTGRYLVKIHAPKDVVVKCNVRLINHFSFVHKS